MFLELKSTAVFLSVLLAIYTFFFSIRLLIILYQYTNFVKSRYFFGHHDNTEFLELKFISGAKVYLLELKSIFSS